MSGSGMTETPLILELAPTPSNSRKATNADTVTVTSTTITGAKSITYEKAATAAAITTGAGADVCCSRLLYWARTIATNSGNDSIQFLER